MQKLGRYLLTSNLKVYLAILICALLPIFPFNLFTAVLVAFVTLQRNTLTGLGALAWAALPSIATNMKFEQLMQFAVSYDWMFVLSLLAWAYAMTLRHSRNWSRVLDTTAVIGIALLLSVFLLPAEIVALLLAKLKIYFSLTADQMGQAMSLTSEQMNAVAEKLVHIPLGITFGVLYAVTGFFALLCLMLARAWQLVLTAPPQKRLEFYNIRLSRLTVTAAGSVLVAAQFVDQAWLTALAPLAFVLVIFAGISLFRFIVAAKIQSILVAFAVLVVAFFLILYVLPTEVVLGVMLVLCLVDSWIDLRQTKILLKRVNE